MGNATYRELEAICNATDTALFLTDDQGRCLFMNSAASRLTGYEPEELDHRPLYRVLRGGHPAESETTADENGGEGFFVHKDGHLYEASFSRHRVDAQYQVLELRGLMTEKRRLKRLRLIAAIGTELNRAAPADDILAAVGRTLGEELGINICLFCDFDPTADTLKVQYTWRRDQKPRALTSYRASQFFTREVLEANRRGETFVVTDTARHSRLKPELFTEINLRSFVAVPTGRGRRWRHLLVVGDNRVRQWQDEELEELREVASRLFPGLERVQTEQALRESELKYRTLFETMNDGFAIIEMIYDERHQPIDYRYLEVNPAFEKHTGFKDAAGKRVRDFLPGISSAWLQTYADVVTSREPVEFVAPARLMGRWFDISAFPFGDAEQGRLAIVFTDVTETKRREVRTAFIAGVTEDLALNSGTEEIIQAVGKRLGGFLGISGYFMADIDEAQVTATIAQSWTASAGPDLRGVYHLPEYVSERFLTTAKTGEIVVVDDAEEDPRTLGRGYGKQGMRAFVTLPIVRSGRWRYLLTVYDERVRHWREDEIELLREVANRLFPRIERTRAQAALRESESRYRSLFESIGQGFAVLEVVYSPDGQPVDILMVETNPAFGRHSTISDATGRKLYEIHPAAHPQWLGIAAQVEKSGETERRIYSQCTLRYWCGWSTKAVHLFHREFLSPRPNTTA
jgi:PAS domain S-box-containing protein